MRFNTKPSLVSAYLSYDSVWGVECNVWFLPASGIRIVSFNLSRFGSWQNERIINAVWIWCEVTVVGFFFVGDEKQRRKKSGLKS